MKIDKAIELLLRSTKDPSVFMTPDHDAAAKLGIEALRRVKSQRLAPYRSHLPSLLGEDR